MFYFFGHRRSNGTADGVIRSVFSTLIRRCNIRLCLTCRFFYVRAKLQDTNISSSAAAIVTFNMASHGPPSPNKTPRKKNRASGYSPPFYPVMVPRASIPTLLGEVLLPPPDIAGARGGRLTQYRIPQPQQGHDEMPLDNDPLGCDWARIGKCLCSSMMAGPSLVQCRADGGCFRFLHHMCQTEWESEDSMREAYGNRNLCAFHHPALAGLHTTLGVEVNASATPRTTSTVAASTGGDGRTYPRPPPHLARSSVVHSSSGSSS